MDILKKKIVIAKQSIDETTDLFYQNKTNEGYKRFEDTITVLTDTINNIFEYKNQGYDIGIEEPHLVEVLTNAMNAMEEKDALLLSDILNYELKELFEQVDETISLS